ncbi:MAG: hypothetical protein R2772_05530 [Chitinophagales bacterium]
MNQTKDNLVKHLGIEFSAFGDDFLDYHARRCEDASTLYGILHGERLICSCRKFGSSLAQLTYA